MSIKPTKISRQKLNWLLEQPLDVKMQMLGHHMQLCRLLINELLDEEVCQYTGQPYQRDKPHGRRYQRWGYNPGSVKIGSEKLPIEVPRVRDRTTEQFQSLERYDQLSQLPHQDQQLVQAVIHGLSQGDYGQVVGQLLEGFGLSQSSVSREFIEHSRAVIESFENRDLSNMDLVGLAIDGKYLAGQQIVIALGIDTKGNKIPLGFIQTTTENGEAIGGLIDDLIQRGLSFDQGLLCIIDGAKGLRKALEDRLGEAAVIQRCQWHKRENVVSYLPADSQDHYRRRLQNAYQQLDYKDAQSQLVQIQEELKPLNRQAARSLGEGLEETLTLHRLGMFEVLGASLKTTNTIENLNSQLGKYIGRVKRWHNSEQRYRWIACGMVEIETNMRRISNYSQLPKLKDRLTKELHHRQNYPDKEPLLHEKISTKFD